jgi:hypothetical protein
VFEKLMESLYMELIPIISVLLNCRDGFVLVLSSIIIGRCAFIEVVLISCVLEPSTENPK